MKKVGLGHGFCVLGLLGLVLRSPWGVCIGFAADLRPEALEAFSRYTQATEARIDKELARPGAMLYLEGLPEPRRSRTFGLLKHGDIIIERLRTLGPSGLPAQAGRELRAPGALIHHWMGAIFVPGMTLQQTLGFVQDYDHHARYYQPEMVRSKLVSRGGNEFRIFYRLREHKVITVTLNTEHEVRYTLVDRTHAYSRSYSTRIAEVEDADRPGEHEKPPGHDDGFLWRINSYWRFEEREGGVYVECESISLTRDIPVGLGWLIGPFITSIPKESLEFTLGSTQSALLARKK